MKTILVGIAAVVGLLVTGSARAATNPAQCRNDIDCVATPDCGGEVCPYEGNHAFTCQPAGQYPKGADGWCTVDSDCKCHAQGAVCVGQAYCSFTLLKDAPGGGATGGSSGATGGSSGATGGSSGATGGSSGATGGSSADAGTNNGGGSSGGCAVAGSSSVEGTLALLGALGLWVARRRKSAR
jgi:hypothetical protein